MNKITPILMSVLLGLLLISNIYMTYAFGNLNNKLSESYVSLGQASASTYSFNSAVINIDDLPDMAGGC